MRGGVEQRRLKYWRSFLNSAELDAIPPAELRALVVEAIERHLTMAEIEETEADEAMIKELIEGRLEAAVTLTVGEGLDLSDIPMRRAVRGFGEVATITDADVKRYLAEHVDEDDMVEVWTRMRTRMIRRTRNRSW